MKHFYHPFERSSLGFLSGSDPTQNESSLNIIEDIDLYQQPVDEPSTAIVWFVVRCFAAILSEMCNYGVLCLLKTDNSILTDVTRLVTYTAMVHQPMRLIFYTLTDFIHPIENFVGEWGCRSYWFIDLTMKMMIISHSLIVALSGCTAATDTAGDGTTQGSCNTGQFCVVSGKCAGTYL